MMSGQIAQGSRLTLHAIYPKATCRCIKPVRNSVFGSAGVQEPISRRLILAAALSTAPTLHNVSPKSQVNNPATSSQTQARLNSGHLMPLLGLGTSGAKEQQCTAAIREALGLQYRHIDTAEIYGNEEAIGAALGPMIANGDIDRSELFVTSKLWSSHHAAKDVRPAIQASLKRLQLDYLDLYLIHWPHTGNSGPKLEPSLEETWEAMEKLADEGLAKSIGVSNFSPQKIQPILDMARIPPAVNQVEVHPNFRNDHVLHWCTQHGIHVSAYAPLSSPQSMQSMNKSVPNMMEDDDVVAELAKKHGKTPAQTLLRWGLQHGTSVLPKSASKEHMQENLGAFGWELPEQDMAQLSSLPYQEKYFSGSFCLSEEGPYKSYEDLWDEPKP